MTWSATLPRPSLWSWAVLGAAIGLAALWLAELPDRWVFSALAGAWVLVVVLGTGQPRRAALLVFAFSLQIGLALYLTKPLETSAGASWPNALALPVASLSALGALAIGRVRRIIWGGEIATAAVALALTTAVSIAGSPVPSIGVAHLVLVLAYYSIFLAAANTVHDGKAIEFVRRVLTASLILQSLLYFAQTLLGGTFTLTGEWVDHSEGGLGRYGGTVGTRPAAFSSFLLPLLLLAVARFLTTPGPRQWLCHVLPAAVGSAALVMTYTRASWIAFALGLGYLLAAGFRRRMLAGRNVWLLVVVLTGVGAALSPKILMRASHDHSAAFEERWALAQMALRVIQANPVTGVGAGAYPFAFRQYLTPDLADKWLFVVHNVYMLRAAETGLPGLAAMLFFLWVAFRHASPERMAYPEARVLALGLRAGLIALSWEMLWDVSLGPSANSLLWFLCGLMAAAARATPGRRG